MKLYGIKTCGSVKKALAFFKEHTIDVEFIDLRSSSFDPVQVVTWAQEVPVERLLNTQGRTYKTLNLKALSLNDTDKIAWMQKEPLLIKRPVIIDDKGIVVGFDASFYQERYL